MPCVDGHDVVLSTEDSDIDSEEEKQKEKERAKVKADQEVDDLRAQEVQNAGHPDAQLKDGDLSDLPVEGADWQEIMSEAVKMRIVTEGVGDAESQPAKEQYLVASYDVWLMTDTSSKPLQSYQSFLHKMGEGEAIPALELAWRYTKPGGVTEVACVHRFAWGPEGHKGIAGVDQDIPAGSHLFIRTTLEEVLPLTDTDPDDIVATWDKHIRIMGGRKTTGNDHFKRGSYDKAIRCYEQGVAVFLNDAYALIEDLQGEQKHRAEVLVVDCASNLAACHIELQDGPKAMLAVDCGLPYAVNHLKLNIRAAKAEFLMSNFKECERWLGDAKKIAPDDAACIQLEAKLKRARQRHAQDERRLGKKLVSKANWSNSNPEPSWPVRVATQARDFSLPYLRGALGGALLAGVIAAAALGLNYFADPSH